MKFLISKTVMQKALEAAALIIDKNGYVPAARYCHMRLSDGRVVFTATNIRDSIERVAHIADLGPDVGPTLIDIRRILRLLKALQEQPLTVISVTQTTILHSNGKSVFYNHDISNWQESWMYKQDNPIMNRFPEKILTDKTQWGNFLGKGDLRPALQHLYCSIKDNMLTAVATNAHLLCGVRHEVDSVPDMEFLISGNNLKIMKKLFCQAERKIRFLVSKEYIWMEDGVTSVSFRMNESGPGFPKWRNVIPREFFHLIMNRKELIEAINTVSVTSNHSTRQIIFRIIPGYVTVHSDDLDEEGMSDFTVPAEVHGALIDIGLNYILLLQAMAQFSKEESIRVDYDQANRAVLLTGVNAGPSSCITLVMPVMINHGVGTDFISIKEEYLAAHPIPEDRPDIFEVWK